MAVWINGSYSPETWNYSRNDSQTTSNPAENTNWRITLKTGKVDFKFLVIDSHGSPDFESRWQNPTETEKPATATTAGWATRCAQKEICVSGLQFSSVFILSRKKYWIYGIMVLVFSWFDFPVVFVWYFFFLLYVTEKIVSENKIVWKFLRALKKT